MSNRYEVWVDGVRVGKREAMSREYTHAVVGYGHTYDVATGNVGRASKLEVFCFAGNLKLAEAYRSRFSPGAQARVVEAVKVEKFAKVDAEGRRK